MQFVHNQLFGVIFLVMMGLFAIKKAIENAHRAMTDISTTQKAWPFSVEKNIRNQQSNGPKKQNEQQHEKIKQPPTFWHTFNNHLAILWLEKRLSKLGEFDGKTNSVNTKNKGQRDQKSDKNLNQNQLTGYHGFIGRILQLFQNQIHPLRVFFGHRKTGSGLKIGDDFPFTSQLIFQNLSNFQGLFSSGIGQKFLVFNAFNN